MDNILSKYNLDISGDKVKATKELVILISETYSSAERDIYIQVVAKTLGVEPKSIKSDVDRVLARNYRAKKKEESEKIKQDTIGYSDRVNLDFIKAPSVARNEEHVLGLLFTYPEHRKTVFENGLLSENDFYTELNKRFFALILRNYRNGDDSMYGINEEFSEEEVGRATRMKTMRMHLSNGPEVLMESIKTLKNGVERKKSEKVDSIDQLKDIINKKKV